MAKTKWQLAGVAAVLTLGWCLAVPSGAGAAPKVVPKLVEKKIVGVPPIPCDPKTLQYVIDTPNSDGVPSLQMCGGKSTLTGPGWQDWGFIGLVGNKYQYITMFEEDGSEVARFFPTITQPGMYEVWVSYRASENRTEAAPFYVYTDSNVTYKFIINQHGNHPESAKLGTFFFNSHTLSQVPRTTGIIALVNESMRTSDAVDAVFIKYIRPATPTGLTATDGTSANSITLRWTAVPGAKGYRIFRSATNDTRTAQLIGTVKPADAPTYTDTPLNEGKTYYYWVKTVGVLGKASTLSRVNAGSTGVTPDKALGVTASQKEFADRIKVTWSAVNGATAYWIYRGTTDVPGDATRIDVVPPSALEYFNTGLNPGESYYYFVRARNLAAAGPYSDPALGSTTDPQ